MLGLCYIYLRLVVCCFEFFWFCFLLCFFRCVFWVGNFIIVDGLDVDCNISVVEIVGWIVKGMLSILENKWFFVLDFYIWSCGVYLMI